MTPPEAPHETIANAADASGTARVDLPLIWRAAAIATGDAGAGRSIAAKVARAHPKPASARESTLVASYIRALDMWREVGAQSVSPEPLALSERAATTAARLRASMDPRTLDTFILRDILCVGEPVLRNAIRGTTVIDERAIGEVSAEAIDDLRTILSIETEPMLRDARAATASARSRKRRLAIVQFAAFAIASGFLVYVKIDLKRAADEEKASRVPSMVEQFSNPLPDESSESP